MIFVDSFVASIACALLMASGGCRDSSSAVAAIREREVVSAYPLTVDAGVVLVDRPFYMCIPLERVGLRSSDKITSLHSSCDCISVQLVEFRESGSKATSLAFLLESVSNSGRDKAGSDPNFSPSDLRIEVGVELSDGQAHHFFVEFIESTLVVDRRASGQSPSLFSGLSLIWREMLVIYAIMPSPLVIVRIAENHKIIARNVIIENLSIDFETTYSEASRT